MVYYKQMIIILQLKGAGEEVKEPTNWRFIDMPSAFRYPGGYIMVSNYKFSLNHYFETNMCEARTSFGYIVRGQVELRSQGGSVRLSAGDTFYIPSNEKYSSIWTGTPDIDFYGLHVFPPLDAMSETGSFAFGKVELPDGIRAEELFVEMHRLMGGGAGDKLRAVGMYYDFAGRVLGSLRPRKNEPLPEVLCEMMSYIDRNSRADDSVPELAARFHMSESALYQLFRRYLGTTPVSYRNGLRIERSLPLIESGKSVEETAAEVGFNSSVYFRAVFIESTGMTPSEYRKSRGSGARGK